MSSTLYPIYAESESKTCKERGEEFTTEKYNTIGYELIYMISNPNHTEDIKLTLCWIVDDQIQVGKLITLYAKASSERYVMNDSDYKITITFPKELINYWEDPNHTRQFNYTTSNQLVLVQNNSMIFESKPINFRFTVPENISILYCEYFPNKDCFNVSSILRPASYYLDQEIKLNKKTIELADKTTLLTKEILSINMDLKNLTCFIASLTILLVIISIITLMINNSIYNKAIKHMSGRKRYFVLFASYAMIPFVYTIVNWTQFINWIQLFSCI